MNEPLSKECLLSLNKLKEIKFLTDLPKNLYYNNSNSNLRDSFYRSSKKFILSSLSITSFYSLSTLYISFLNIILYTPFPSSLLTLKYNKFFIESLHAYF